MLLAGQNVIREAKELDISTLYIFTVAIFVLFAAAARTRVVATNFFLDMDRLRFLARSCALSLGSVVAAGTQVALVGSGLLSLFHFALLLNRKTCAAQERPARRSSARPRNVCAACAPSARLAPAPCGGVLGDCMACGAAAARLWGEKDAHVAFRDGVSRMRHVMRYFVCGRASCCGGDLCWPLGVFF